MSYQSLLSKPSEFTFLKVNRKITHFLKSRQIADTPLFTFSHHPISKNVAFDSLFVFFHLFQKPPIT